MHKDEFDSLRCFALQWGFQEGGDWYFLAYANYDDLLFGDHSTWLSIMIYISIMSIIFDKLLFSKFNHDINGIFHN